MREWIEIEFFRRNKRRSEVLPRMREWIEIFCDNLLILCYYCSPSYEGVD